MRKDLPARMAAMRSSCPPPGALDGGTAGATCTRTEGLGVDGSAACWKPNVLTSR